MKKYWNNMKKVLLMAGGFALIFCTQVQYAYAANIGQNISNWFGEQLFWLVGVIAFVVIAGCLMKKNTVGMIVTALLAGIIMYLVKNPKTLSDLGEKLTNIFISGGN